MTSCNFQIRLSSRNRIIVKFCGIVFRKTHFSVRNFQFLRLFHHLFDTRNRIFSKFYVGIFYLSFFIIIDFSKTFRPLFIPPFFHFLRFLALFFLPPTIRHHELKSEETHQCVFHFLSRESKKKGVSLNPIDVFRCFFS